LVRMEWCQPGLSVYLPLVILPSTIKSTRSFLLAPAHPELSFSCCNEFNLYPKFPSEAGNFWNNPRILKKGYKWLWYRLVVFCRISDGTRTVRRLCNLEPTVCWVKASICDISLGQSGQLTMISMQDSVSQSKPVLLWETLLSCILTNRT